MVFTRLDCALQIVNHVDHNLRTRDDKTFQFLRRACDTLVSKVCLMIKPITHVVKAVTNSSLGSVGLPLESLIGSMRNAARVREMARNVAVLARVIPGHRRRPNPNEISRGSRNPDPPSSKNLSGEKRVELGYSSSS
jgi:hypothetical protein